MNTYIVKGDICFSRSMDARQIVEEGQRLLRGHVEHVRDIFALIEDLQRLAVIPLALFYVQCA